MFLGALKNPFNKFNKFYYTYFSARNMFCYCWQENKTNTLNASFLVFFSTGAKYISLSKSSSCTFNVVVEFRAKSFKNMKHNSPKFKQRVSFGFTEFLKLGQIYLLFWFSLLQAIESEWKTNNGLTVTVNILVDFGKILIKYFPIRKIFDKLCYLFKLILF